MERKIILKKRRKNKLKYKKHPKINLSIKLILKKFLLILLLFILYKNKHIHYLIKEQLKLKLIQYQSKVLPEIISFENNLSITKEEMNEFRNINSNNILIEKNNFKKSLYPDVSIIMTMYNQAHCIHKGIRSVQNQSLKNIEIIIVDDCSQDNGTDVIKEFQKNDPE